MSDDSGMGQCRRQKSELAVIGKVQFALGDWRKKVENGAIQSLFQVEFVQPYRPLSRYLTKYKNKVGSTLNGFDNSI